MAMLIDVTGHLQQAEAMLAKAQANLVKQGAKETRQTMGPATVLIYDLPLAGGGPGCGGQARRRSRAAPAGDAADGLFPHARNMVGAADNLDVIVGILARLAATAKGDSLADVAGLPGGHEAMRGRRPRRHARRSAGSSIRWAMPRPPGPPRPRKSAARARRSSRSSATRASRPSRASAASSTSPPTATRSSTARPIYAPPPYDKSMKMFVLPNKPDRTSPRNPGSRARSPPTPRCTSTSSTPSTTSARCTTSCSAQERASGPKRCDGLSDDPNGPRIDLRKELIENLGQRVTMVTDYKLPITTTSERLLFAIEAKDEAAVAKALEKSVKNDPTVEEARDRGARDLGDRRGGASAQCPRFRWTSRRSRPGRNPAKPETDEEDRAGPHFLPHGAITVAHGQLLVASHIDFLLKVLKPCPAPTCSASNLEFQQVWDTIAKKLGIKAQCARSFSFTDEELRPTYELIRQGKMPESETLLCPRAQHAVGGQQKGDGPQTADQGREAARLSRWFAARWGPAGCMSPASRTAGSSRGCCWQEKRRPRNSNRFWPVFVMAGL